jgi:hypothetical protein
VQVSSWLAGDVASSILDVPQFIAAVATAISLSPSQVAVDDVMPAGAAVAASLRGPNVHFNVTVVFQIYTNSSAVRRTRCCLSCRTAAAVWG